MLNRVRKHTMDSVSGLLILAVFAASALMLTLLGIQSYTHIADLNEKSFDNRLCARYIAAKIRHNDNSGGIFVADYYDSNNTERIGIPTLYLRQQIGAETYDTRIYHFDGRILEIFSESGLEIEPDAGNTIMEMKGFNVIEENGTIFAEFTDEKGEMVSINIMLRSSGGIAE